METNFIRIPLIKNSKNPSTQWSKITPKNPFKGKIIGNYGIKTGEEYNLTVVDLDSYKWNTDHSFNTEFKNFIDEFDTLTIETGRGGHHLYFEFDEYLSTTNNKKFEIDIRSNDGYVVGFNSVVDGKEYKIIRNTTIKKVPDNLKNWLLENLYNTTKEIKEKEIKDKNNKNEIKLNSFNYDIDEKLAEQISNNLDDKYFNDTSLWYKYTTFCKIIGQKEIWDRFSKKSELYDEKRNQYFWNSVNDGLKYSIVEDILKASNMLDILRFIKYKNILPNTKKPTEIINSQKLGYDFFNKYNEKCIFVKSDTGTGKTTSFKHFIKEKIDDDKYKFISIVSRVSLGQEQYEIFSSCGISCKFYKYEDRFSKNDNIIIQLDSIIKIAHFTDYSNHILFMDEINSIIEYLITSSTLTNKRKYIYEFLEKLIKNCALIICTDADICDNTFYLFDNLNINYRYIENNYKHSKGKKSFEISNLYDMIDKLKKEKKFIVCTDSKTEAEKLYNRLNDKEIKIITSDTIEYNALDCYDKIIFTPKIIYGLDSTIERPVYCIYTGKTINPKAMVQQLNRNRNITSLYYHFENITNKPSEFYSPLEIYNKLKKEEIISIDMFNDFQRNYTDEINLFVFDNNDLFIKMLSNILYNDDAYNTNKRKHFKNIIKERGFIDNNTMFKPQGKIDADTFEEKKLEEFDIKNEIYQKINTILQVPEDKCEKYKELFIDNYKLIKHFNICNFFFKDKLNVLNEIQNRKDFNIMKFKSNKSKILFLNKLTYETNIEYNDNGNINHTTINDNNRANELFNEYKELFGFQGKSSLDFTKINDVSKTIKIIFTQLFGNVLSSKQIQKNKTKYQLHTLDINNIKYHNELYSHRNINPNDYIKNTWRQLKLFEDSKKYTNKIDIRHKNILK
jgi:hypothetical protein